MPNEAKERWQVLCELAATEQDPAKFLAIIQELNDALEQRDLRLKQLRKPPATSLPANDQQKKVPQNRH